MTPNQTKLVAESFNQLESRMSELGAEVYSRLFKTAPELRALFTGDMAAQHGKLVRVFDEFVKLRKRSQHFLPATDRGGQAVVPGIDRLRSGHRATGVQSEHYAMMRAAILDSLASMLGDKFDSATAEAWGAAFDMLAEAMQKHGHATPAELKLLPGMLERRFEDDGARDGETPSLDSFFSENGSKPEANPS
jgi:nitric oxide dioxygenase